MRLARRVALFLVIPPAVAVGLWGVIFVFGVLTQDWAALTTPEELTNLREYVLGTTAFGYAFALCVVGATVVGQLRSRRPARPAESTSTTMLRYWWVPAALAAVMLAFLAVVGILAIGWRRAVGPQAWPDWGPVALFILVIFYLLGGAGFAAQFIADRSARTAAARAAARVDAGVVRAELALVRDPAALPRIRRAVNAARWREARWATIVAPVTVVLAGLALAGSIDQASTLFGLGADTRQAILVVGWILAAVVALGIWWFAVVGLIRHVRLLHVTVRGAENPEMADLGDAVAAGTGVTTARVTVAVHGAWSVTGRGLRPLPHGPERTLDRARRYAGAAAAGEEAVLICSENTMIGRLADHLGTAGARR